MTCEAIFRGRVLNARAALSALLAVLLLVATPARADEDTGDNGAIQVVERFHEQLIEVMRNAETWDYAQRRGRLAPAITENFDTTFMARVASGTHWKGMTNEDKVAVVTAFRGFTVANYAARFNGYSGQQFETVEETPRGAKRSFVKTKLVKANGEAVEIDYLLRLKGEKWLIVDIYLEGRVSELALRRSEFAPILSGSGTAALVSELRSKIASLEAEADTA